MRLIKAKFITLHTFSVVLNPATGVQEYTAVSEQQILATITRLSVARAADFQIDVVRIKDHLKLSTNQQIPTDQSVICEVQGRFYLPLIDLNDKYQDPRTGIFETLVKLNIDKKYGLVA